MKPSFVVIAMAGLLMATGTASAQSLSFGATLTSDYISRGVSQTGHDPAFQPWIEYESNGWYAGLWASNVAFAPDNVEIDLYGGYRWAMNATSLDVGYARYFYDSTGDASGELYLLVEQGLGETAAINGGIYLGHSGGLTINDAHIGFSASLMPNLTASTTFGVTPGSMYYGLVELSYAVNDNFSLEAVIHDATAQSTRLVVSTDLSF